MGSCHIDTSGESLLAQSKYNDVKSLKKLYRNYYKLESEALKGNQMALCIVLDLKTALEPSKHIITIKQRFSIVYVLMNGYTVAEAAEILQVKPETIEAHIKGGLINIQKSINNGELYNNKYEMISKHYKTTPIKELAAQLNMTPSAVKALYGRMKKRGEIND